MFVDRDTETGQVSVQFPDCWMAIYPAGIRHERPSGKEVHYRGALLLRHGEESIHLNAFDIDDLERFLTDPQVVAVRDKMTTQHVQFNFARSLIALGKLTNMDDSVID